MRVDDVLDAIERYISFGDTYFDPKAVWFLPSPKYTEEQVRGVMDLLCERKVMRKACARLFEVHPDDLRGRE